MHATSSTHILIFALHQNVADNTDTTSFVVQKARELIDLENSLFRELSSGLTGGLENAN